MRACRADLSSQLRLTGEIQPVTRTTRVQLVPKIRPQIRVIVFRLPGTTPQLTGDRGTMHPEAARDLCPGQATIKPLLDLDSVFKTQMTVMCGQGSATLRLSA